MRRRELIILLGSTALAWPLAARAQQQPTMPVVGFLSGRSLATDKHLVVAFRQGLGESGYVEGRDVTIDYSWAQGQLDRLPLLAADLVTRKVSVIFAGGMEVKIRAVKDAISTIPVVFATGGDPVELGLVASMNRPGGNATAVTVRSAELWPRLRPWRLNEPARCLSPPIRFLTATDRKSLVSPSAMRFRQFTTGAIFQQMAD
jgi:putative ABC transport system substrate-binding protein